MCQDKSTKTLWLNSEALLGWGHWALRHISCNTKRKLLANYDVGLCVGPHCPRPRSSHYCSALSSNQMEPDHQRESHDCAGGPGGTGARQWDLPGQSPAASLPRHSNRCQHQDIWAAVQRLGGLSVWGSARHRGQPRRCSRACSRYAQE